MFPVNPFPSKYPVLSELEEVFPEAQRAVEVIPGVMMFTLPPHPARHLTVSDVVAATSRTEEEAENGNEAQSEDADEDDNDGICPACNGSGEGAYDGTSCGTCHPRRGSRNNNDEFEEPDHPDLPDNYDGN